MVDAVQQTWQPALAGFRAAALDPRVPDVPAAARDHRRARRLSGALRDLPVDAQQIADPLHRARQLPLAAVARRFPNGGRAGRDLHGLRRRLQGADRADHGAPHQQPARQGPAQVARHAAGAVGDPARALLARLVVAVRSDPFGFQLYPRGARLRRGAVALQSLLGALLRHSRQHLVRRAVLSDHVSGGVEVGARAALRGGRDRRRQRMAEVPPHHAADDAQHHRHHDAVLADRHFRQFRHRADHDGGRPAQHDARVRDLRVHAGHPFGRHPGRRRGVAVHAAPLGGRGGVRPARRAQAREGDRMTAATLAAGAPPRRAKSSLVRNRRWALFASYFFLVLFAIFFLIPPYYMIVTALKSDAEVARMATNPWIIADGVTLDQFRILFTQTDFLIFFKNTVIVTVCVVAITMVVSVLAAFSLGRMRFWGSSILATGIFLTYLVPDTLLFLPLFQIVKAVGLLNSYWGMVLVYPTLTVPFCTWIMIGYFQSIPKELDEAALIDGAGHMQMLTKIFIPVALPGIIAAMIFAFTVSWAAFVYPMAFLYSADQQVLTVGTVTSLIRGDVYKWGMLMAGALLAAAPPLVIYAFLMDYYIAGLTAGATKG